MPNKPRRPPRPRPKSRAEFLAREKEVWDEMAAAWCRLPDEALSIPGACGPEWSVKDVMNHVAAWLEAAQQVIPQLMKGQRAAAGHSVDKFNALHHAEDKDRTLAASKRRLNRARRELLALIAKVPDRKLLDVDGRIGWWIKFSTYAHYGEHIYELSQFRRKITGSE